MGKKSNWFSALKKALSPKKSKSKKREKNVDPAAPPLYEETKPLAPSASPPPLLPPQPPPPAAFSPEEGEKEQKKHAYSVALATAVAAEAAVAAAQAAAEVVRLTSVSPAKSTEEVAATKIQTAFRGYLARRALRALRGLVRLKTLIQGQSVKRQAANTLRAMQTLARVQSQIRARRIRMSEENQALQRQLHQKRQNELEKLGASSGERWDDSSQSKEQVEAKLMNKQEAAMRRERALAYAFSHQQAWKNSSKSPNPTFMDPNNPQWGWSWLERWMSSRPWESKATPYNNDPASSKSTISRATSLGEIGRAYSNRDSNNPNTPSKMVKTKPPSPRGSSVWAGDEVDSRSSYSVQSDRNRRHSIAGSSVRDDESLASSPSVPSYMGSTQSAKAKSRLPSPSPLGAARGTPDRVLGGSAKKQLSFSPSSTQARRHSGPPRMELLIEKEGFNGESSGK